MEWLVFIAVGAGGAVLGQRLWRRRGVRAEASDDLEQVKRFANEDVTLLGEELQRLGMDIAGVDLDEDTRLDYQRALDAYESAQRAVPRMADVEEISTIADTLANGRYSMVCVRARLADDPIPERRVPCFFNPQHGPSVMDVMWTPAGRGTRKVPACSQDAARVAAAERPDVRYVSVGARRVPYWEAGAAYAPYAKGYFVGNWAGSSYAAIAMFEMSSFDGGSAGDPGGFDGGGFGGFDGGGFDGGAADGGGMS
ncbi:MAG TPA: hypothetical protein VEX15_23010 [Nocardioidaceae bacterium]|nr:hypothetical protein [Nocardioidaceae bacterium]